MENKLVTIGQEMLEVVQGGIAAQKSAAALMRKFCAAAQIPLESAKYGQVRKAAKAAGVEFPPTAKVAAGDFSKAAQLGRVGNALAQSLRDAKKGTNKESKPTDYFARAVAALVQLDQSQWGAVQKAAKERQAATE